MKAGAFYDKYSGHLMAKGKCKAEFKQLKMCNEFYAKEM